MATRSLILCNGLSGSGKTTFIQNYFGDAVYNLKSMTTREMRDGEKWGDKYYFVDTDVFAKIPAATTLFVNEAFWTPEKPKWLYGVPEFEIKHNLGRNLVYDVIQPRYARQLIDWFNKNKLNRMYNYTVLWFLAPTNNMEIAAARANMPDDCGVRTTNTCDAIDFLRAGLQPDYILKTSAEETIIPDGLFDAARTLLPWTAPAIPRKQKHVLELLAEYAQKDSQLHADYKRLAHEHYFNR